MLTFSLDASSSILSVGATANEIVSTSAIGDLVGVGFILIIIILYGFLFDPNNMLISLFSMYAGYIAMNLFPFELVEIFDGWLARIIIFLAVLVVSYITLLASRLFRVIFVKGFFTRWFKSGLIGLLHGGLFISIIISFLPSEILGQFSTNFLKVFISDMGMFLWFTVPLLAVWLIRAKRRSRSVSS